MNCLECQSWLQSRLDGEAVALGEALEQHWAECPTCREQYAAALRLLDGLKQLPPPRPPAGFADKLAAKVLHDRRVRRAKIRRRVFVTMALAACILLALVVNFFWSPRSGPEKAPLANNASPVKKVTPSKIAPEHKSLPKVESRNALASLTERWADTTRDHARVVLVATNLDNVDKLPAVQDLPPIDPGVQEAGHEVSEGVRAVTQKARRAFDFFARELPMPEMETQKN